MCVEQHVSASVRHWRRECSVCALGQLVDEFADRFTFKEIYESWLALAVRAAKTTGGRSDVKQQGRVQEWFAMKRLASEFARERGVAQPQGREDYVAVVEGTTAS